MVGNGRRYNYFRRIELSDVANLINTIGFPAAMVVILLFLLEVRLKEVVKHLSTLEIEVAKCVVMSNLLVKDKMKKEDE